MTLRTLSIGLSAAVLLGAVAVLFVVMIMLIEVNGIALLPVLAIFLALCGFPPVVSIIISVYSKSAVSQILAAVASLLYGFLFVLICINIMMGVAGGIILLVIWVPLFLFPCPLWITAIVIEICHWIYHRKKNQKARTES